jgi:polysaccharide pyruvyl transferase WcaK-like protein
MDRVFLKVPGRLANWTRAIKTARRLDLIIIPGTGPLCDYASGPGKSPYGFFRWAAAAKLVGVPLHFICTGSGPITHPLSRMMLMFAARSAATRSFRDGVSKAILAGLGLDTSRDHVFPDLVFRLPVPQAAATLPVAGHPLTYGIGVMDYNGWQPGRARAGYDEYLRKMARYVARLLSEGHRVRLLMGEKADRGVIADLCRILEQRGHAPLPAAPAVAAPSQLIAEPIDSLHDLMAQIVDTDIVVATRFHNVICALKLARPTVSIGYDAKNEAIMAEMGLAEFSQYIETLDLDRLEEQTAELLRSRSTYTDWIRRRLVDFERRLAEQDAVLISSIV